MLLVLTTIASNCFAARFTWPIFCADGLEPVGSCCVVRSREASSFAIRPVEVWPQPVESTRSPLPR
jgi:hypothetical protein